MTVTCIKKVHAHAWGSCAQVLSEGHPFEALMQPGFTSNLMDLVAVSGWSVLTWLLSTRYLTQPLQQKCIWPTRDWPAISPVVVSQILQTLDSSQPHTAVQMCVSTYKQENQFSSDCSKWRQNILLGRMLYKSSAFYLHKKGSIQRPLRDLSFTPYFLTRSTHTGPHTMGFVQPSVVLNQGSRTSWGPLWAL